jgi:cytoskeleton protein RodZ
MSNENAIKSNDVDDSKSDNLRPRHEFGIYLREARQAAGLLTADVADRLKLSEEIIKSLENSRIDVLPAPAFTQGYIKAYAKLLKISPDEIMHAYDMVVPDKVAALNFNTGLPAEHSTRDNAVKITSYVMIALAFIMFVIWIQQSGFELSGNFVQQNEVVEEPAIELAQPDLYPENMLSGEPTVTAGAPSVNELQIQAQPIIASDKKSVSTERVVSNTAVSENQAAIKIENKALPKPAAMSDKPVAVMEVKSESRPVETANADDDDVIKFYASADSWAEVQDADNNRLFYSLLKTGSTYAIKGRAPFRIFLGNAPSVSIEVNSQLVDVSRYVKQNNIAHVKISAKASTQSGGSRENVNQVIDQFVPETSGTNRAE